MHEDDLVLIGALKHRRGGVVRDPALVLADVQQHREHALLGGGAGIEVVGEDLVQRVAALVHDHLAAVEVGQAEGRRDIDDAARGVVLRHVVDAHEALHVRKRQREEGRVGRADHQRVVAVVLAAGAEGQQDDALGLDPLHGLPAELGELIAVHVLEAGLVGGQIVADAHAVGVAAAHIVLHEVDGGAVLAAHDLGLLDHALAGDGVGHVVDGAVGRAVAELKELILGLGIAAPAALGDGLLQVLRQDETIKERIDEHGITTFLCLYT